MTPEERADPVARLVEDVGVYDSELGWVVCADDIGRLLGEAVQSARLEALEEAAKIAENEQVTGVPPDADPIILAALDAAVKVTGKSIAAAIRERARAE